MSGCPNPEGVVKLRRALRNFSITRDRIAELNKIIAGKQLELEGQLTELRRLRELITECRRDMDVESVRNFGWENRHFELLIMLAGTEEDQ